MSKLAVVTGTSAGLGAAVAKQLVSRGWTVVGIARRSVTLDEEHYHHISLDLSDADAVEDAIEDEIAPMIRDRDWSRVGLVNNAASVALLGPLQNADANSLLSAYSLSFSSPVALMAAVSRHTRLHVALRIVNVSSGAAVFVVPGLATYASAKAGLRWAGMILAAEWTSAVPHAPMRTDGSILSYEPGIVDTAMQKHARSLAPEEFPWVEMFQRYEREGRLVSPDLPAADIVKHLESNNRPAFEERRYGTPK